MKKFVVMLLSAVMVCSLAACGKTGEKTVNTEETVVSAKDLAVNVENIGTPEEVVVDKETNEVLNEWKPAAGRTGAFVDVFEGIDTDNARAIVEYAGAADEAGYNAYLLLGTKQESDAMLYAYTAVPKREGRATSVDEEVIIVVRAGDDGSVTVKEFEGTRDDIVDPGTEVSSDEPADETAEDANTEE